MKKQLQTPFERAARQKEYNREISEAFKNQKYDNFYGDKPFTQKLNMYLFMYRFPSIHTYVDIRSFEHNKEVYRIIEFRAMNRAARFAVKNSYYYHLRRLRNFERNMLPIRYSYNNTMGCYRCSRCFERRKLMECKS